MTKPVEDSSKPEEKEPPAVKAEDEKETGVTEGKEKEKPPETKQADDGGTKEDKKPSDSTDGKKEDASEEMVVVKKPDSDSGENLIEIEDPDDYLLYLEHILQKIHEMFYKEYDSTKQVRYFALHIRGDYCSIRSKYCDRDLLIPNRLRSLTIPKN